MVNDWITLNERFEFLAKNIEPLHEAVFDNTRQIAQQREQMSQLRDDISALTRVVSSIANTVSDMALIARDHERRLTNLEGAQ